MPVASPRSLDSTNLVQRIQTREARVGVIGLGFAGLPLALESARAGFATLGFDVDADKVARVNAGESPVSSLPTEAVHQVTSTGRLQATSDFRLIASLDAVVICVPTPLTPEAGPDTRYVESALRAVAEHLASGTLVVLQSSSYAGCTREIALPILEANGGRVGEDFFLAYAPERIDPGNRRFGVRNTPKLVGGITARCGELACAFYRDIVDTVVPVASPEVAEMAKLVENTFRFVNISLVNEVALLCDRLGIDVWQVLDAAGTKPFSYLPHYPGPGVGGDCIPVMPQYLAWTASREDLPLELVLAANRVNRRMPDFVVEKLARLVGEGAGDGSLRDARILVVGVSYKSDVADVRNAPSLDILARLQHAGARVSYHDPYVPSIEVDGDTLASTPLDHLREFDAVVLATPHKTLDYARLIADCAVILDTRNALASWDAPNVVPL